MSTSPFEVVATREAARVEALATRVATLGGHVTALPVTRIEHEPLHLGALDGYDAVIAASANAVPCVVKPLLASSEVPVFAVGAATAEAFAAHGITAITPARADAIGLAEAVLARAPRRVLWPRAHDGRDDGIDRLRAAGVIVDAPIAYRSIPRAADDPALAAGLAILPRAAIICVYAPSQAAALHALAPLPELAAAIIAIGETTAAAVRELRARVAAVAAAPDPDAMAMAIAAVYPGAR
jgi:uroporphyrinogen-III synthase